MRASTTQETLVNSNDDVHNEPPKLLPSISTLETDDFHTLIQQQYGAYWGTFKFEDSLSDYSNDVSFISINSFYFVLLSKARPFLYIDDNIDLHVLRQFMINEWDLKSANIVLPVLSGVTNHKPLKNQRMTETLRNGIKNVGLTYSKMTFI
jgi:hypothetical protein